MITYWMNYCGPINEKWIEDNAPESWSGGRLDIHDGSQFGQEETIPIMLSSDWTAMSEWIGKISSKEVKSLKSLVFLYEAQSERKIKWWIKGQS